MYTETDKKRACSLTAEDVGLLPFLPYLLQDLWSLGSSPEDIVTLIQKHMDITPYTQVLDIACGKGAVSVRIALKLGIHVYGCDLTPEFVDYAAQAAWQHHVHDLCRFACIDANEAVEAERDYDCVIFGGAGDILGDPGTTLRKLAQTVKPGGCIILDEAYLPPSGDNSRIEYKNYEYLPREVWLTLFAEHGLTLLDELPMPDDIDMDADTKAIAARAEELAAAHPDKRGMFEGYVRSQQGECADLEENVTAVTWILRKDPV
ncbi:MAG: class I SAM-dependent methyltransferase [Defluviitaleaceae bacterium]|nr:class I SAM-dependent methyltransferase [Defluviitaleaceae bacterium]